MRKFFRVMPFLKKEILSDELKLVLFFKIAAVYCVVMLLASGQE
jgi:hypothetical protein